MTGTSRSATSRLSARASAKPSSPGMRMSLIDELGRRPIREVERGDAVERLVHDAARGAKQVGDEPGDAGVVVRDDHAAPVEAHVGRRPALAPHRRRAAGRSRASPAGATARARPPPRAPSPRTAPRPAVRATTTSRTRAIAPHTALITSVPSPSGTRTPRPAESTLSTMRLAHFVGEPLAELLERRLAERHAHRDFVSLLDGLVARAPQILGRDRLRQRARHAERDEPRRGPAARNAPTTTIGTGSVSGSSSSASTSSAAVGHVGVDHDDVRRHLAREPDRRLRVVRPLAS